MLGSEVEFGESFSETEDWDVISFNGLDSGVTLDLSQLNSDYEAIATTTQQVSSPNSVPGIVENTANGHFYQAIDQYMSWDDAKAHAEVFEL